MTREHKLSLVIGFSVMLAVGVLISDHLSSASSARLEGQQADVSAELAIQQIDIVRPTESPEDLPAEPERSGVEFALGAEPVHDAAPTLDDLTEPVDTGLVTTIIAQGADLADLADQISQADLPIAAVPVRIDTTSTQRTHIVRSDDTMFSITKTYYGTGHIWRQLQAHNADRVGPDGELSLDVALIIPPREALLGDSIPTAPISRPAPTPTPQPETVASTYIVQPGDILGQIAQDQLGTVHRMSELIVLNDLDEPDDIRVGMILKLPMR